MKRACVISLALVLVFPATGLFAQIRMQRPNDFSMEIGGRCGLYCMSYQRMVSHSFGLEVGASYLGGGVSETSEYVLFLTGGGRFYLLKSGVSPCLSAGIVYITAGADAGPLEAGGSGVYFYASPGFEYRMPAGFLLRGTVNFLMQEDWFLVWPGLTLGISF